MAHHDPKQWRAQRPANIALIKYMGKRTDTPDAWQNQPCNPSLSYTLDRCRSEVILVRNQADQDRLFPPHNTTACRPMPSPSAGFLPPLFTRASRQRFLSHLKFIKTHFQAHHLCFDIYTYNNFPLSCGIASSASSFAALTDCAVRAIQETLQETLSAMQAPQAPAAPQPHHATSPRRLSQLSQCGSGSSCRSFFSPWALWEQHGAAPLRDISPLPVLQHRCILVDTRPKLVSSSQAHQRVKTSPHFAGRIQRARGRLYALLHSLQTQNWSDGFAIIWEEFQDMHALFRTASPYFDYITPQTQQLLDQLQQQWQRQGDGPWVTLDAGPNIHCFFRETQQAMAESLCQQWGKTYRVITGS